MHINDIPSYDVNVCLRHDDLGSKWSAECCQLWRGVKELIEKLKEEVVCMFHMHHCSIFLKVLISQLGKPAAAAVVAAPM